MIGSSISRYKVLAKLGEGGMGVVYRTEDAEFDRTVSQECMQTPTSASRTSQNWLQEFRARR